MALWLLRPTESGKERLTWDCAYGFVVRADTAADARRAAQNRGGDEVRMYGEEDPFWLDHTTSTCELLEPEGEPGVVLRDFSNG